MAARQRLRVAFDARRASQPCWRCALHLPRYSSTSPAGIPNSLQNTEGIPSYSQVLQWDVENRSRSQSSNIPPVDMEPVSRSSRESDPGSSQTVHRFRIRGTNRSRPMFLGTRSQSQSRQPIRRVMIEGRPVSLDAQSQSSSAQAVRKPRIRRIKFQRFRERVVGNTRLISLGIRSQSQAVRKPRIRGILDGRPVSLDAQSQSSDTRSPSQSMSAVQQTPTRESSEGGSVPLGTREVLCFRKVVPESKHELDPVMALDTRSPSQPMSAVQQSPTQESSEGGSLHAVGAEATSPAKRKTKIVDIKGLKYGARRLVTNSIIKKHIVSANRPGAKIRGTNVHYVMSYLNRGRIIRRVLRDPHHTKTPRILYLAGRDDATRLVRKAGPPLRERPTDAGQVPSKDQQKDEAYHKALTLLLDSSRNLHTSEPPNPTREIKKRRHFSSQHWTLRRVVSSESRTSNRQSLVSKRSFSTRTPRNPKRHHATATVSNREAALGFHMLKPSTESDLAG